MEIKSSLNEFLNEKAICGFEIKGVPFSAFWAVEKGHSLAKEIKEYYEKESSFQEITNTVIFSKLLVEKYGADPEKDQFQELKDDIKLSFYSFFSGFAKEFCNTSFFRIVAWELEQSGRWIQSFG